MPKALRISNKLLSLRDRIEIFDVTGAMIYSCSRVSLFSPRSFVVVAGEAEVARVKRKLFSWTPTWLVAGKAGDFAIRTRIFSLRRVYDVRGGPLHGAEVRGNLWDARFTIALDETLVAQANKRLISLRDTHVVEVVKDDDAAELFTVIAMIVLLLHNRDKWQEDREEEQRDRQRRAFDDGFV